MRGQTLGFERRRGECALLCADAPAQDLDPMPRAFKGAHEFGRQLDVVEPDVVMDRRVAEQHVDQLPGIAADCCGRERDAHLEYAAARILGAYILDVEDTPDDLVVHKRVVDRLERHLDALLDSNHTSTLRDRTRIAANAIDRLNVQRHSDWSQRPGTPTAGRCNVPIGEGASRRSTRRTTSLATMAVMSTATIQSQTTNTPRRPRRM